MGIFQLGPLSIKYEWLFLLVAGVATYWIIQYILKNHIDFQKEFIDSLVNAGIIFVVVYKFSIVLFRPSIMFDNPLGIIYFTGGIKGGYLGSIAGVIYFISMFYKKKWTLKPTLTTLVYSIVTFTATFWLMKMLFLYVV